MLITGSHIPFDRNDIKFHTGSRAIRKAGEAAVVSIAPDRGVRSETALTETHTRCGERVLAEPAPLAGLGVETYCERALRAALAGSLVGQRVGV